MSKRNVALLCLAAVFSFQATAQTIGGCPVFPANNIWNARVDTLPVHARSAAWISSIGPTATLHQDFGGELYNGVEPGIPFNLVSGSQPKVNLIISPGADESDPGPYPIPPNAKIEGGSDLHLLVVDTTNCMLYETLDAVKNPDNSWNVYSAATFDLRKNLLRPQFWTSSDAAGLPVFPGLARYEEILAGEIRHALRFTAPRTTREFLWPARHYASYVNDPSRPSMGARFRLKANFDISSFSPTTQIILTALKRYGMMLADNGSPWYIQGAYDPGWPNLADEWRRIPGSAFEAVETSGLIDNIDSAAVRGAISTPTLSSASIPASPVTGGQGASLRVSLSGSAPAGGLQVTLSSDNSAVAPITASVLIPEGSSSADVPVTTSTVPAQTQVVLTASLAGVTRQATLTVNAPAPTLASAQFLTSQVTGGQGATLRVTLSAVAPAGGITVTLGSGNTGVATVASSVQIPSGSSSTDAPVSTNTVQSATQVIFTASLTGVTRQATLTVNPTATAPSLVSVASGAPQLLGGDPTTFTITLSAAAPQGGLTAGLSSTNAGAAALPPSVTVPAGSLTAEVAVTTSAVGSQTLVTLSATLSGVTRQVTLTVTPPAVSVLAVNPSSVQGGTGATCSLTLNGKAPAGGLMVSLISSNTSVATVPGSVMVGGGQTSATFSVATQVVNAVTTVQLQASALGRSVSANLGVSPPAAPAPILRGLAASYNADALRLEVAATLSAPAGSGGVRVNLNGNNNGVVNLAGQQILIPAGSTSAARSFAVVPPAGSVGLTVTGTVGEWTRSASLRVWNPVVTVDSIRSSSTASVNQWVVGTVTFTGPSPAGGPTPALASTGVINQTQWVFPLSAGRNAAIFAFRATAKGSGTISVSLGGVTKSVAVTVR